MKDDSLEHAQGYRALNMAPASAESCSQSIDIGGLLVAGVNNTPSFTSYRKFFVNSFPSHHYLASHFQTFSISLRYTLQQSLADLGS